MNLQNIIFFQLLGFEKGSSSNCLWKNWLDISHAEANKSYALNILQKELGITKEETMVFGNYNNDLEIMELGYLSFAMANAHEYVKKTVCFKTKSNAEEGVEAITEK